jgi:ribonuclease R
LRKGRFLVAEPFFADPDAGEGREMRWRSRQVVVGPARGRGRPQAAPGDLVLLQWPARARSASAHARVARVIGSPEVVGDVLEALMLERGLHRGFEPEVQREARAAESRVGRAGTGMAAAETGARRLDLRELPTFTVDPVSARDFDDAISAEPLAEGGIRVWVHIADVSAYVPEGSELDKEAWRRGTSVYVPGAVEPMLPEELSTELCSLTPGDDRLAVSVELDIDGGETERAAFHRSIIRSDGRLDYEQVDRIFTEKERAREPWGEGLKAARMAAAGLAEARRRRRALELDSFEPEFTFDGAGGVRVRMAGWASGVAESLSELRDEHGTGVGLDHARAPEVSESRRMIEHLMIAANEAVARQLADRSLPCLYRVHEPPEPQRAERLVEQLASLKVPTPPAPEPMSTSQAAALLAQISVALGRYFRQLAARTRTGPPDGMGPTGSGGRMALTGLLLRALQQAYYSPRNIGHAGLGSAAYCHFTSPIRRYPDLVCHRALLAGLGASESIPHAAGLGELGVWASEREREAMSIEREANDVARCFALEQVLGENGWELPLAGEIIGLIGAGVFVAFGGDSAAGLLPPFEGMIPVRRLREPEARHRGEREARNRGDGEARRRGEREWWELNEQGTILRGSSSARTLRLADTLNVRVVRVERARGRVELGPSEENA